MDFLLIWLNQKKPLNLAQINIMKSIIYIAIFAMMSVGLYAQDTNQQSLAETTKETSYKISQELNLDDDKSVFLYRAIYSTERSRQRAEEQMSEKPEQLAATNQKIDKSFEDILKSNFSESEISQIKKLYEKK